MHRRTPKRLLFRIFCRMSGRFEQLNSAISAKARAAAQWGFVLMCFSLGISRSLFVVAGLLTLTGWVFSGQWRDKWRSLKNQPAGIAWLALISWTALSISWSEGTLESIRYGMGIQWKLIFIPLAITLINSPLWLRRCWQGFAAGMFVLLVHVYLLIFTPLPWVTSSTPSAVFFNPLPQAIGLSIFAAWCLNQILENHKNHVRQAILAAVLIAAGYAVFQVSIQRLGYISLIGGCAVVVAFRLPRRARAAGLIILMVLGMGIAMLSPQIRGRIDLAVQEVQAYHYENTYSSLGARLHMWYISTHSIRRAPWLGHGVGSYPAIAKRSFNDAKMCEQACGHPHNQYLFYTLELGVVGLFMFLGAIFLTLPKRKKWISSGDSSVSMAVLLIFVATGFADSTLWYRGYLYLFIVVLSLAAIQASLPDDTGTEVDEKSDA